MTSLKEAVSLHGEAMSQGINEGQVNISDLIGLIYDSAQNPELWPELLHQFDGLINETNHSILADPDTATAESELRLRVLHPHFKRALTLNKKLYALKSERAAISGILDRLPIGVILVDRNMAPVAINRHAEKIIDSNAGISIQDGRVVTDSANSCRMIEQRIMQTIEAPDSSDTNWNLMITSSTGTTCSLHITSPARAGIETENQIAALFITCNKINHRIGVETLAKTYGLTNAESRLLQTLLNGSHSLSEAATTLGVSKHTVRSQFKSILEKTGTHSQTELIKRALIGPVLLTAAEQSHSTDKENPKKLEMHDLADQYGRYQLLKLSDGRTIEFREYGDPDGMPLLYFHGILHSRRRFHPLSNYIEKRGIRVIAPERPGHGLTSRQKKWSISNFCEDIKELLNHLGIEKFYLLGDGDGGPWALGCACLMPGMVYRGAVCGCMPDPNFEHLENLLPFDRKLQTMARITPKPILYSFGKIVITALKRKNDYFELMGKDFHESDQKIVTSKEHKALFRDAMDSITPKHIEGFIDDYFCRLRPWDFPIEETETEFDLWHGVHDCFSDIESAKDIANAMPCCRTHFLEERGHYLFISHCDEILAELIKT